MFSKLVLRPGLFSSVLLTAELKNRAACVAIRCSSSTGGHPPADAKHSTSVSTTGTTTITKQLENWDKANQLYFGPQRDLVNFPLAKRPEQTPPVRLGFIPESWFVQLYDKTGVTGPYVFGAGLITFLLSKEIWIVEHQFAHFVAFWASFWVIYKKYGDKILSFFDKSNETLEENMFYTPMKKAKDEYENVIVELEKTIWREDGQKYLFEAKKENVDLQLESIYRQRLAEVYQNVKKRLDYHLEVESLQKRVQQQHMVTWIVDNVVKNITPQQEKESLTKCIQDLKALAVKASTATA